MEMQLQELLDKIQTDGVDAAKRRAAEIVAEADAKAARLIADAEREAVSLVESAKAKAARTVEAGNAALAQASRDILLSLRDRIQNLLSAAVQTQATSAMTPELLAELLPQVLRTTFGSGRSDVSVLLPQELLSRLDSGFAVRLAEILGAGIELHPFPGTAAGIRVSKKGDAVHYDFSAESLADLLAKRLNSRLAEIVRSVVTKD